MLSSSSLLFLLRRKQARRFLSFLVAAIVALLLGLSYRQLFHFHVQQQQQQQQLQQQQHQLHVDVQPKQQEQQQQQHVRTSSRLVGVPQRDMDGRSIMNDDKMIIRSWGCTRLRETPLIFIHVGKMGGGTVRARLAAAALGYNRTHWHNSSDASAYYYPVGTPTARRGGGKDKDNNARGYFCNSAWHQFRYWQTNRTFEGTMACHATTPVGQAIACPEPIRDGYKCMACSPYDNSSSCHVIYAGHNLLGNELHHLPPQYLMDWWKSTWDSTTTIATTTTFSSDTTNAVSSSSSSSLTELWQLLQINNPSWCPALQQGRPQTFRQANRNFQACAVPLGQTVDAVALEWVQKHPVMQRLLHHHNDKKEGEEHDTMLHLGETFHHLDINLDINWGPLYASLPVVRTIVVREPFSWLLSKFTWHGHARWYTCDNVTAATHRWYVAATDDDDAMSVAMVETKARGWAHAHAVYYLLQVCGEDCQIKWEQVVTHLAHNLTVAQESALLASFERQADYNLRHAFGVVGLQDDIDGFYDMLTARVRYLNMSSSSSTNVVEGPRHTSHPTETCRNVYGDEAFRQSMMEASPAIAAIVRLHQTARRVHAFQKKEMEMCVHSDK